MSSAGFVESVEESLEDGLSSGLALGFGAVSLSLERWPELDGGLEAGAALADDVGVAVDFLRPGAVSVAERSLGLGAQVSHAAALVGRGKAGGPRFVVERLDLGRDGEVLVGDGAVGDARVDHGHCHGLVAEEGGDGLQAHSAVDGLGCKGVAELVGVDVADAGVRRGALDCLVDA